LSIVNTEISPKSALFLKYFCSIIKYNIIEYKTLLYRSEPIMSCIQVCWFCGLVACLGKGSVPGPMWSDRVKNLT